ncbi:PolC-type DNA polymerase III [Natronospora cellulosivora (SeqCode)]
MIFTIKPDDNYSHLIKYLSIDKENKLCKIISAKDQVNNGEFEEIISSLKIDLADYEISILPKLSIEDEIKFVWPQLIYELKDAFPYINGWLERARLKLNNEELLIELESNVAYKNLNGDKLSSFIKKCFQKLITEQINIKFVNGNFLEEIPVDTHISKYQTVRNNTVSNIRNKKKKKTDSDTEIIYGKKIKARSTHNLNEVDSEIDKIIIEAEIFDVQEINTRRGNTFYVIDVTDNSNSITVKIFPRRDKDVNCKIKKGKWVRISGYVQYDKYSKELVMIAEAMNYIKNQSIERIDNAEEKRVELHLHTQMSAMDSVVDVKKVVARAAKWGHPAIAITDHGVVQSYPDAYWAGKEHGIKVLYGLEAYMVDDGELIIQRPGNSTIAEGTYTVFDLETTGFHAGSDKIIEIGAVKIKNNTVIDTFTSFVKIDSPIPPKITEITGINNDMLKDAAELNDVIDQFLAFVDESILVAHNASFDYGFLKAAIKKLGKEAIKYSVLDTLNLSRAVYPQLKSHKLNKICDHLNIDLDNHHRALDDAKATGDILIEIFLELDKQEIMNLKDINNLRKKIDWKKLQTSHLIILAKNKEGLKAIYKLVSNSHINHYYRKPRILKSELSNYRDNLIIGSACEAGQLYRGIIENKDDNEIKNIAKFHDFLEIQPLGNNKFLLNNQVASVEELQEINKKIYNLGKKFNKPVIATGDVHFLDPDDSIYRKILQAGQGFDDLNQAPLYFRTTEEMLEEFKYLGEDIAKEVVIENPQKINQSCEELEIIPKDLYTPTIEGADEEIRAMAFEKAKTMYGDPLPELVEKRLERELNSIIGNGYAVIYLTSQKLVKKSLDDGYLVGSRGSVGSSFAATMTGITEVNPLPPHYRCGKCKHSEFIEDGSVGVGVDLPDKECPKCGEELIKDGFDIPFEVFLGFKGDKVPDIDLNFSGEYQATTHKYTETLFGKDYVYRAGTISSIAERTAFGFVKGYLNDNNLTEKNAEIKRLVKGCTGVKRTTGQHPGGQIVVPNDLEIYDFTPIQKPANDMKTDTLTTHFDFHSIHDNLLKLDILGHDDPTTIRMLQDITGVSPFDISLDDPDTMSIFSSTEALGVTPEEIDSTIGTLGIPEFGTSFVRQMLVDTKPNTFAELIRISGLSHGTDVWLNNAQDLIRSNTAELAEVISVRDDIMNYLIQKGLEPARAFWIMENVRKGKGLKDDEENYMRENNVPEWYIDSCKKIKYMFPKAHAAAYVMMAFRIAFFKVHYPEAFYATFFTRKADDFDAQIVCQGYEHILKIKGDLDQKGNDMTAKEKGVYTILEIVIEAMARGIKFTTVDLYQSEVKHFKITDKGLLPPLTSLEGLGESAAQNIVISREESDFTSIEELVNRTRISKTVVEVMKEHGTLNGMPDKNQLSLF